MKDIINYSVIYGNDTILKNCNLSLELEKETLGAKPVLKNKKTSVVNEQIAREIPLKNAIIKNNCNVLSLNFKNNFSVEFRAYNEGIAYRFITAKENGLIVKSENVSINF